MLFEELKSKGLIQPGSCASMVENNDPCLPAINHFLSLQGIPGFDAKKNEFLRGRKSLPEKNSREVDFAGLLAEFEAMRLIGKGLGLTIVGLEQAPPESQKKCYRSRTKRNRDILRGKEPFRSTYPETPGGTPTSGTRGWSSV